MSAGAVALITSMQPILVALLAPTFTGELVTSARWVGLALGLSGAVIVIAAQVDHRGRVGVGDRRRVRRAGGDERR